METCDPASCQVFILIRISIFYGILAAAALLPGADLHAIAPPGAAIAGPYSPGVMANDFLYVAGQGPVGATEEPRRISTVRCVRPLRTSKACSPQAV